MAKRSYSKKRGKLDNTEDVEVLEDEELLQSEGEDLSEEVDEEPQTTTLVLMKQLKKKVLGPVTGKLYVFDGAGAKVDVDNEDVEGLLKIKNPNNCCSGTLQQPYFTLAE